MGVIFKKDRIIAWDIATGESYGCEVYGRYNKKGELIIDDIKYFPKEEKKMKFKMKHDKFKKLDYLSVKVVKVEKKRELHINPRGAGKSTKYWSNFSDEVLERLQINAKRELERRKAEKSYKEGKWSGNNWVNGENLDKIKFPCFCSYTYMNVKHFGELRFVADGKYGGIYTIFNLHQEKTTSRYTVREFTLKAILENYDIHILKGKIILWKEE